MKIEINDHRKIYTVQKEFSALFPFLRIEFFGKPHTSNGPASTKLVKQSSKTLGSCRTIHTKGVVNLTPNMTVRELKTIFADAYGLSIQVSRALGNKWIVADHIELWSLDKQNSEAQHSLPVQQTV